MLDGNVAAGKAERGLRTRADVGARSLCGCGAEARVAEARAFVEAPGLVLRCASCDNALVVLVRAGERHVLSLSGLAWLELRER
jgi:hypothetical protein